MFNKKVNIVSRIQSSKINEIIQAKTSWNIQKIHSLVPKMEYVT